MESNIPPFIKIPPIFTSRNDHHPPFNQSLVPSTSSSSSDPPSSPTSTSFYSLPRSRKIHRTYQSSISIRSPPSDSTKLRAHSLANARKAREPTRVLQGHENPWLDQEGFEPGGMVNGQWELYTDEEERVLNHRTALEAVRRRELMEEKAEMELGFKCQDDWIREEMTIRQELCEEEPPSDLFLGDDGGPSSQHPPQSLHLPSFLSEPDYDLQGDFEMDLDPKPAADPYSSLPPSSPPPDPDSFHYASNDSQADCDESQ